MNHITLEAAAWRHATAVVEPQSGRPKHSISCLEEFAVALS